MYLLFVFRDFYPKGGAEDLAGMAMSKGEAIAQFTQGDFSEIGDLYQIRANIYDIVGGKIVAHYSDFEWFTPEEYREYIEEY